MQLARTRQRRMQSEIKSFRRNHVLHAMIAWLLLFWLITAIAPINRQDWLLENLLVFAYVALLASTYRVFAFSNLSYGLFALFMTLHLIGAHYTYTETPFGFWFQAWFDVAESWCWRGAPPATGPSLSTHITMGR